MVKKRSHRSQEARERKIKRGVLLRSLAGSDLGKTVSTSKLKETLSEEEPEVKKDDGDTRTATRNRAGDRTTAAKDATTRRNNERRQ